MGRAIGIAVASLVLASCAAPTLAEPSAGARPTADFRQAKVDIAYSALVDEHVERPTSRALLTAALEAIKAQARATRGSADEPTPEFQDVSEFVLADFKKFAGAAASLAARNRQLSADRIADAAIGAMIAVVPPDCHTKYLRGVSTAEIPQQVARAPEGGSRLAAQSGRSGLERRLLPGQVGYVAWRTWGLAGDAFDIATDVRRALDELLAQGARAWLIDLRGNPGGLLSQTVESWFLDGEPLYRVTERAGAAVVRTAQAGVRLPREYQLPIAVLLNGGSASASEFFALGLKENRRATIVGQRSAGCIGASNIIPLPDGSRIQVTVSKVVGAVTGADYHRVGIPPDVPADEGSAIDVAARLLREQIAKAAGTR